MDSRRLEHIIIIILVLLNGFLLALVLTDSLEDRNARRETAALLAALLEENGIAVGGDVKLVQSAPAERTVVRDMEQEALRVNGLLGPHTAEDLGGGIWFYNSDRGQIVVRGTGEMDYLPEERIARTNDPVSAAARLLRRADVELYTASPVLGENEVELCCCWDGYPVYNAVLKFNFSQERFNLVGGTLVFSRETAEDGSTAMDSAGVLVRFVQLVKSEGLICSELTALTPGYAMTVTVSGESTLTPVWRLTTDTGDVFINAVSGRPETFSD